jgi:hypothetical protein
MNSDTGKLTRGSFFAHKSSTISISPSFSDETEPPHTCITDDNIFEEIRVRHNLSGGNASDL